ncbi:MAG TPA: hypothetical protein VK735_39820 [Pseudonocardia sp.]|uniref:hypothetical protein n=1 Tax=Pseudonocardia sp. TaxID=60912 RepID=UPI002B9392F2|nr:hypothetical protein [Pseudonocardia sp.]HTF53632.1 hypothetical protein [Pseudonocardia sp.]
MESIEAAIEREIVLLMQAIDRMLDKRRRWRTTITLFVLGAMWGSLTTYLLYPAANRALIISIVTWLIVAGLLSFRDEFVVRWRAGRVEKLTWQLQRVEDDS